MRARKSPTAYLWSLAVFGVGLLAALVVALVSPDSLTFLYLGKCLLSLGLLLVLVRGLLTVRRLSVAIRAEIGLLVISVAVSLVLGEVGLRLFLFQRFPDIAANNLHYRYDATLGWFPIANSKRTFSHQRRVSVVTNSKGFLKQFGRG